MVIRFNGMDVVAILHCRVYQGLSCGFSFVPIGGCPAEILKDLCVFPQGGRKFWGVCCSGGAEV